MFFIYDCKGNIVGNPKGYATYKGANRQAEMPTSKAYKQIWAAFYAEQYNLDNLGYPKNGRLIHEIKRVD